MSHCLLSEFSDYIQTAVKSHLKFPHTAMIS